MRVKVRSSDPAKAQEFGRALGVSSTLAQLLMHRGIEDPDAARGFLLPKLSGLSDPSTMVDRQPAAERLARAVRAGERIAVFGDYDVDGTTAAAILTDILRALGADVSPVIAERFGGGYGFSEQALERVVGLRPTLVVTCDCGSSDHPRLADLQARGIDAVVVDHHLVPDEPLPVAAFLNPHRPECGFAYKGLCSAGLALSLGAAVRAELQAKLDVRRWLDLVALGTIADVAPLDGDNRSLVRAGLRLISSDRVRPGIAVLKELAKIRPGTPLGAGDVAFRLSPRLNAPGRLGDQRLTLELLLADRMEPARMLAAQIEQLNQKRKTLEQAVTAEAQAQVEAVYGSEPASGVVAAAEGWHRGVVGITAARLVERFRVPAVVVALERPAGHGSGRAPDGFPLYDALARCSDTLERFGGHQAASGVVLAPERLDAFRAAFADATTTLAGEVVQRGGDEVEADIALDPNVFDVPVASELSLLEPQGQANAEPRFFVPQAAVKAHRVVGEGHLKLSLRVGSRTVSAFGYGMADALEARVKRVQAVGMLRPDAWLGGDHVELRLEAVQPI
ncbi:MAG: single-stranded-DNA-specific exonuclease RecJ [Myxococcales bacterium]|nr:single-stranded-DNA-specific exonuclease RecJ [Myxococcales bacterium]